MFNRKTIENAVIILFAVFIVAGVLHMQKKNSHYDVLNVNGTKICVLKKPHSAKSSFGDTGYWNKVDKMAASDCQVIKFTRDKLFSHQAAYGCMDQSRWSQTRINTCKRLMKTLPRLKS